MIHFTKDKGIILARRLYREQNYLLDFFHHDNGRFHASARITKQKTHRATDTLAPFQEILISGQRKQELASIWQSEVVRVFSIAKTNYFHAVYLNELIIDLLPLDDPAPELYQCYTNILPQLTPTLLRVFEWMLLQHLGIIAERQKIGTTYTLIFEHNIPLFMPSKTGFEHDIVEALLLQQKEYVCSHPQARPLLQTLLYRDQIAKHKSRRAAMSWQKLRQSS